MTEEQRRIVTMKEPQIFIIDTGPPSETYLCIQCPPDDSVATVRVSPEEDLCKGFFLLTLPDGTQEYYPTTVEALSRAYVVVKDTFQNKRRERLAGAMVSVAKHAMADPGWLEL